MISGIGVALSLFVLFLVAVGLYWLIRVAVRHGIRDRDSVKGAPSPRTATRVDPT